MEKAVGETCPQVENTQTPSFKEKQSSPTLETASHGQVRAIKGVFMFRSAAQKATTTKSALAALQESPSQQKSLGNWAEDTKKPEFGKFNVDTNKTQKTSATGDTTRKQKKHRTKPRITDSYKTRNNLKWKRINELKVKPSSGKEDNKKVEREVPLCFLLLSSFPVQVFYFSSCTLLHSKISREMLRKKLLKKRRNKNKQIDKQEQTTDRKETIKTTHVRERRSVPRVGWEGTNNSV